MLNNLSERTKMLLRLLAFLSAFALLVFLVVWFFFLKKPNVSTPQPLVSTSASTQGLPQPGKNTGGTAAATGPGTLQPAQVANGGVTAVTSLTQGAVTSPTMTRSGTLAYYDKGDGRFYSIDANGNISKLSEAQFPDAQNVTFSRGATEAVVEFPDGNNVVYDFSTAKQVSLPALWNSFSFSSDGSQIAAKSSSANPDNQSLIITSSDGSSTKVVRDLGSASNSVDINWSPDGHILAFSRTGSGTSIFGQNIVYLMDDQGEAVGILATNGTDLKVTWAPDGNYLLYSVADAGDDYRASLWYNDARGDRSGKTRLRLPVKTTADKCVFASTSVAYCAVPKTMPAGGGSDPLLIASPDQIYRIDLPSGRASLVASTQILMHMFHLQLSADGSRLYFTDQNGKLSSIRLK